MPSIRVSSKCSGDVERYFFVSDLLKTNPPPDRTLHEDFDIVWGGCMHHATRNFVLAADDD